VSAEQSRRLVSPWADAGGQVSNPHLQVIDVIATNANGKVAFSQATAQSTRGKRWEEGTVTGRGPGPETEWGWSRISQNLGPSSRRGLTLAILETPSLVRVNRTGLAISLFPLISKHGGRVTTCRVHSET
jgi:hypothetical protein